MSTTASTPEETTGATDASSADPLSPDAELPDAADPADDLDTDDVTATHDAADIDDVADADDLADADDADGLADADDVAGADDTDAGLAADLEPAEAQTWPDTGTTDLVADDVPADDLVVDEEAAEDAALAEDGTPEPFAWADSEGMLDAGASAWDAPSAALEPTWDDSHGDAAGWAEPADWAEAEHSWSSPDEPWNGDVQRLAADDVGAEARMEAPVTAGLDAALDPTVADAPPVPSAANNDADAGFGSAFSMVRPTDEPGVSWRVLQRFLTPLDGHRGDARVLYAHGLIFDVNRHSCVVPEHHAVSFGTYFNAFPASYWRRWTDIDTVRLRLKVRGNGKVTVFRSTSAGMSWSEQNAVFGGAEGSEVFLDLSLDPFIDGGWYWFDILAFGGNDVVIEEADWSGRTQKTNRGRVSVGITTFNRPDYCVEQIRNLGAHSTLLEVLDRVYVVDQGTDRVRDHPEFAAASIALADKLTVIEQGNLGGSGGFARSMCETLEAGTSDYLLLTDDDVIAEPEGIIRAVTFADLARQPILVGGHMFSIFVRSVLHALGEAVGTYRWMWGPAPHTQNAHDFGRDPLAHTKWLHRRVDVDYNGWWMCLIPTKALREVGLALPMFIKWDDAEFGLRARENGFPTVSLPGFAVWHVPWHEKDDTIDWGSYFHARNRILSALLHSPYDHGGGLPRDSFLSVVKHSLAMQYSPAELILQAIEDLLEGPQHMHRDIGTKINDVRTMRKGFDDARFENDLRKYPAVHGRKPPRRGKQPAGPTDMKAAAKLALRLIPRHLSAMPEEALKHPQGALAHADQQWWRLAQYDSVLVSSADGGSAAWYRRDPQRVRSLLRRGALLHARLFREWPELSKQYRDAVPELSSPEEWRKTFELSEGKVAERGGAPITPTS